MDTKTLSGPHLRTYERIFQHPISHNLEWRDVRSLFGEIGKIEEEPNGHMKITRNGHTFVLHPSGKKDISEMDEIMAIRHFLERSDSEAAKSS
jgi:hypothetical protein